ncbi:MAG: hypothetical protein AAF483_09480 [Planctomycetota bacterium]
MIKSFCLFLFLAIIAIPSMYYGVQSQYDKFQYASKEAQESLEVTEAQSAELNASALKSDTIVYVCWGAILAAISGVSSTTASGNRGRLVGFVVGLVLGAGAGWLCAFVGHWHDQTMTFNNSMMYWVGRWALMLAPVGLVTAVAVAAAGSIGKSIVDAIVGGLIGVVATLAVYCLLQGLITPLEQHDAVFPGNKENQIALFGLSVVLLGGSCLVANGLGKADKRSVGPAEGQDESQKDEISGA